MWYSKIPDRNMDLHKNMKSFSKNMKSFRAINIKDF